jgi:pimeloyl-ACP methyl ester carboxylesterase
MPLIAVVKFLLSLVSLLILAAAVYLLWSWYDGRWLFDRYGRALQVRDDWRLYTGLGLLAWSFLGRYVVRLLLARGDTEPTRAERGEGQMVAGASGSSLYVESHGRSGAPLIIFTHGWGMDSTFWYYARRALGDRFRLLLWDLPGLGRSKLPPDGRVELSRFAQDLAGLVEATGEPVVLVGHSIGGMTIQTLVRDHPALHGRLRGVVLLDTTYTNPLKTMILSGLLQALRPVLELSMRLTIWLQPLAWASKWQSYFSGSAHMAQRIGFGKFVTRSQLDHSTLLATRNPPGVLAKGDLAMFRWDATRAIAALRAPALVIAGDRDIVTKLEANRQIAADSPRGELQVVEGVNHMGPMERADLYNQMIADFVLAVQPSAASDFREPALRSAPVADGEPRPVASPESRPPRLH